MPVDRRDLRRRLFNLAAEQAGYFTAAQARQLGYSYQAQAHHVAAGNWLRIDRGLLRLTEWVPAADDDLARWSLWARGHGVVSHQSALVVHGFGEFESARVHLTVPPGFTRHDNAVTLHPSQLRADEIDGRTGFRITTPARTIIDIAGQAPDEDQLGRAIEEGERAGLLTRRDLRARAEELDVRAALYIERAITGAHLP
ncbi:MAG: type IV toxin-antitoxin system AbiEi family antitoxin domain-containing protein [Dermatophilaceae bacterium]